MTNERQALNGIITIKSLAAVAAVRLSHQANGLIIANGRDFYASSFG